MSKKKPTIKFKTTRATGPYRSFFNDDHEVIVNGHSCGVIGDKSWRIRFQVIKKDINEDGNPNCKWKWITLKQESKTLDEAKDFLRVWIGTIMEKYPLLMDESNKYIPNSKQ